MAMTKPIRIGTKRTAAKTIATLNFLYLFLSGGARELSAENKVVVCM